MSTSSVVRAAARFGVCAAAAGLVTVGMSAPAVAASDTLWIQAPYESVLPKAADGGQGPATTLGLGLYHDNADYTVTDGRLTVDVSGLTGVADVTWPANCAPTGTTAVCSIPEVPTNSATQVQLQVRAAAGADIDVTGKITYQATATTTMGGELRSPEGFETTVRIASGPDLVLTGPAPVEGVMPGASVPVPFSVVNNGNEPAQGVQVTLYVTRGLRLDGLAPQCTSTPIGEGAIKPVTKVDCAFDDVVQPGGSFTLPQPLQATVASYALNERIDIGVAPSGGEDISPGDNGTVAGIEAVNTADFAVRGARVSGAAGETVQAALTFRNRGPAWIANLGSGDPVGHIDFIVPKGATVTGVPENCSGRTLQGDWYEGTTGAPRYVCDLPIWVAEKQTVTFPFQLRIDTVIARSTGEVTLKPPYGDGFAFDPIAANNTAKLVLNPAV
ncbi:hypothetical protein I2W78_39000 [Streptomyces spinoverrucosus]|uniref:hypothetical protein n=1 Tax=Streptomyces spinoverrucosus TaxID=284043 RepID=UPI0018C3E3EF|nr:hypothetical protein [Streptomyces spinoverrucosus]MBG0857680.1 hypothetical protein [Streptomyces spinoverrucosus]